MLILNDDILLLLWKYYIKNDVKCIKNTMNHLNNFLYVEKCMTYLKKIRKK